MMQPLAAIKFDEKRSQFYAHLYAISQQDDITEILAFHHKEYKKAAHHCYAVRLLSNDILFEDSRNDGEVGHPGRFLLEILRRNSLSHHVLIVSRLFGGIKLGPGGVSRAFKMAGNGVVEQARKNGNLL